MHQTGRGPSTITCVQAMFFELTTTMWMLYRQAAILTCGCALALSPIVALAKPAQHALPAVERCLLPAAQRYGVNPQLLRAILQVESGMKPDTVQHNTNGSIDVGMAQINSVHFPELSQWGITPQKLLDPCTATHVAAWHLKRGLLRYGNTWFGVAAYHSVTPAHNARYQALLRQELRRSGALP